MALTRTQLIGLVVIAAVATTTITILVVVDPFTPRYTLTITNPVYSDPYSQGNITYSPGDVMYPEDPSPLPSFKAGTVVTLTFALSGDAHVTFSGPDGASVQTVVQYQTYNITMTKDMSIVVDWAWP